MMPDTAWSTDRCVACGCPLVTTFWITNEGRTCGPCYERRPARMGQLVAGPSYRYVTPPTLQDVVEAIERQTAILRDLQAQVAKLTRS
jgi:hypothetical protein